MLKLTVALTVFNVNTLIGPLKYQFFYEFDIYVYMRFITHFAALQACVRMNPCILYILRIYTIINFKKKLILMGPLKDIDYKHS
jgi:hypothetical protein